MTAFETFISSSVQVVVEKETTTKRKAIGLLGGSFNPVHNGHLVVAEAVLESLQLERVDFMPSFLPPHVDPKKTIDAKHRVAMLNLALTDNTRFALELCELMRRGKSYSIDTIKFLKAHNPQNDYYFIIGGDMVEYLPKWKDIDELVKLVHFVGVNRPNYERVSPYPIIYVDVPQLDISSSLIRQKVKAGQSVRYLLPEAVRQYILAEGLYQNDK